MYLIDLQWEGWGSQRDKRFRIKKTLYILKTLPFLPWDLAATIRPHHQQHPNININILNWIKPVFPLCAFNCSTPPDRWAAAVSSNGSLTFTSNCKYHKFHFALHKLDHLGLHTSLCSLDVLTERQQVVRISNNTSTIILNTGAIQGCVLSPVLHCSLMWYRACSTSC